MSKILIIGANGTVGTALTSKLQQMKASFVKATSRAATKADEVHLNLVTQEGLDAAFNQVDTVFMLCPPGYTNQNELLIPVIKKAQEKKVKKVVLMTAMGVDAAEGSPLRLTEQYLEASGLAYNIIRPNWFMQNFNTFWIQGILQSQTIYLPVADAKGSFIDARDIANTAAHLLTSTKFDNQSFTLTGSQALNHTEVASIMSETLNKKISFQDITPEQMREGLLQAGLNKDYTEFLLMILGYFKLGYSAAINDNVEKITGQKPIQFAQYVQDYKKSWA